MTTMDTVLRMVKTLHVLETHHRGITAREVAEKLTGEGFCASKRTIERDLQRLSQAFPITVQDEQKPYVWKMLSC